MSKLGSVEGLQHGEMRQGEAEGVTGGLFRGGARRFEAQTLRDRLHRGSVGKARGGFGGVFRGRGRGVGGSVGRLEECWGREVSANGAGGEEIKLC